MSLAGKAPSNVFGIQHRKPKYEEPPNHHEHERGQEEADQKSNRSTFCMPHQALNKYAKINGQYCRGNAEKISPHPLSVQMKIIQD
jgi:predicted adenine nucleotide alpha hydrolase (AANH) superfamily ATPase